MTVSLVLRAEKGAPLTWDEADANFLALRTAIDANPPIAQPAGGALAADDAGGVYTNEGASSLSAFELPAAAAGLFFGFIVQDADGISVTRAAGDTINVGASGFTSISNTMIGSAITLVAVNDTQWFATAVVGTWA